MTQEFIKLVKENEEKTLIITKMADKIKDLTKEIHKISSYKNAVSQYEDIDKEIEDLLY